MLSKPHPAAFAHDRCLPQLWLCRRPTPGGSCATHERGAGTQDCLVCSAVKTSLGIWAFGTMSTRFVPGGYQPQWTGEPVHAKVERAVAGLGDLIDGYEFHYPGSSRPTTSTR